MPYISLFPLSERLSELWSLCSSGGLQASSAAVVLCRDCVAVSPTHQIQTHRRTHKHTNTRTCLVSLSACFCLSCAQPHTCIGYPPLHILSTSIPWSPSVSLSSVSFSSSVFHLLSLLPRFQLCYTAKEYKEQQAGYKYSLPTQDC